MKPVESLKGQLRGLDGADYGGYQALLGEYSYPDFRLTITQIPKDPYAPPHTGIYRLALTHGYLGTENDWTTGRTAQIAYRDYLARRFHATADRVAGTRRGTGYSGIITIAGPGQAILDRSSVVLVQDGVELRVFVGLPARGRSIDAALATQMLCEELPTIVAEAFASLDHQAVNTHIRAAEDAESLRGQLADQGLAAFIADGSLLPRESGTSDLPLDRGATVPFRSPESMRVELKAPHAGRISGMGIPAGVTLIVGGGFHGKSTLLRTIETGVYSHVPGDGRERCVSAPDAAKIRAYDGRPISAVDISLLIGTLPSGSDTSRFSTTNASGSTSQAATIAEALEMGATTLLMDEDTCASNLMSRGAKMRELVRQEDEPITTFVNRVRWLYDDLGVSSILVMGGSGDYFGMADTVIQMIGYEPHDVTERARAIAGEDRQDESDRVAVASLGASRRRQVHVASIDPRNEHGKISVYATERERIRFGRTMIDLTDVEQIVELSQTKAIAQAILRSTSLTDDAHAPLTELVRRCREVIAEHGLDGLCKRISGDLAEFREIELAAALNRLRDIRIEQL